jgi:mycothiol synthase
VGARVRAASDERDGRTVHAVLEDAIAGHWNHQRRTFAEFYTDQRQRDGHDPALWLLAEIDGVPVGAIIAGDPADRAWIAWLGVLEEARGRGVGMLLLRSMFRTLHERGHRSVSVDVDPHNATGAVAVYKNAGMVECGRADQWRKTYR